MLALIALTNHFRRSFIEVKNRRRLAGAYLESDVRFSNEAVRRIKLIPDPQKKQTDSRCLSLAGLSRQQPWVKLYILLLISF